MTIQFLKKKNFKRSFTFKTLKGLPKGHFSIFSPKLFSFFLILSFKKWFLLRKKYFFKHPFWIEIFFWYTKKVIFLHHVPFKKKKKKTMRFLGLKPSFQNKTHGNLFCQKFLLLEKVFKSLDLVINHNICFLKTFVIQTKAMRFLDLRAFPLKEKPMGVIFFKPNIFQSSLFQKWLFSQKDLKHKLCFFKRKPFCHFLTKT